MMQNGFLCDSNGIFRVVENPGLSQTFFYSELFICRVI